MSMMFTNPNWLVYDVVSEGIAPPPPVDYLKWAINNIVFSERESAFPGPYNEDQFPYFSEPLRALGPDDPSRIVTLMKSAQVGGTVVANIFTLGSMDLSPCDFLYTHPTDDNASRWSKLKLRPMLKGTTALAGMFPDKSRDGGASILFKERIDGKGSIQISGANSPASLSMVSMPKQAQDDLSKWEVNIQGDPESQADTRSEGYEYAKILKISTPTVMPGCRITTNFRLGSQETYHVPCPHCDARQPLEWNNFKQSIDEDDPDTAHFTCVECGSVIEEHHRPAMVRLGNWVAGNEKMRKEHRSFYIWSAYSPLQSWGRLARRWIRAKGDPAAEQVFLNDMVGEPYEADGEAVPWETLRDRADLSGHARGTIPPGGLSLFMGIDVQDGWLAWQLIAIGRDYRRFVVDAGTIEANNLSGPADNAHISEELTRKALDKLIARQWPNAYGHKLSTDMVAIDGNAFTEDVWGWAKRHPASKVIMVRGASTELAPLIKRVSKEHNDKTGKLLKYARRFYTFNGSILKLAFYRNLKKDDPQMPGYVAFCRDMGDDYFQEVTAERRVGTPMKNGFKKYGWHKKANQRNEMLDTMVQAEVAGIKYGIRKFTDQNWLALEAERESPAPDADQMDLEDLLTSPPVVATVAPETPAEPTVADLRKAWGRRK